MREDWLTTDREGAVYLALHVHPGAKRNELVGLHGNALKVRLAAPPVDGRANEALLQCLANWLSLPQSALILKSGQTSRRKVVRVQGLTAERIREILLAGS
ncbi:MAG: DUF167 domain-containing protein [Betaproteobacteria bacterium]|nr:DUF167 domain-containing protein [Betaproteobacteria bacterium]